MNCVHDTLPTTIYSELPDDRNVGTICDHNNFSVKHALLKCYVIYMFSQKSQL